MGNISVDYDVLNQKGSPAWYSDLFANIPTPGYKGRMFISTDTFAFYRDNGVGWDLVGGPGTGTITGAGVSGQVTYFIGTDTIGGNNNLFYDITNGRLGINTATPGSPLDIHSTGTAAQFNGTGVNNAFVLFQNAGTSKWRIGNLYNSGANDYQIYDVLNATARLTIKNTGATTLTGTFTATSLIKSGGTSSQILLADGTTTPTSTFGAGSVTSVSAITLGTSGTDLSSSVANSTTTPVITLNVPTASATNRGALSSADWTTFNNKQATLSLTTTGTSGAATLVGATLNIPNYTNVGTVTSVAALTLGTSGTDLSSSVANSTSTPVITLNVPTASASNRGALSSADFTTFNNKQATISVTAPVVLTGATISMPAATTSVNGYLTSTDWNTFNNKSNTNGTVTSVVALTIGTSGIDITSTAVTTTTTPVITLNIPTASASNRGALSSTDWTIFNNKQATLSLTTTGTSGVATLVANTLNVPNYGSALSGYLPLSGGTLTGALGGTSASFSTTITSGNNINSGDSITLLGELYWGSASSNQKIRAYPTGASGTATLNYSFWTGSAWFIRSTLDYNGSVTYIGNITSSGNTISLINSTGSADYVSDRLNTSSGATFQYKTNGTINWYTGLRGLANNNFYIFNNATSTNTLILDETTSAATFSSSITAITTITARTSFTTGGTASTPYYDDAIFIGNTNNKCKIQVGNSFNDNNGTWLNFVVNSNTAINTPVNVLTLKYDQTATFYAGVNIGGSLIVNSTLGINGTSNNVRSGTYTPTVTAGTNCAATTAYPCQYMQVDKVVTVSGQVYGSATAVTTETQFTMSVPVGSNFTQVYQCGGTGRSAQGGVAPSGAGYVALIQAVSTDTVRFSYTAPAVLGTGGNFWFSFTYQII